jgi:hypothetical protein
MQISAAMTLNFAIMGISQFVVPHFRYKQHGYNWERYLMDNHPSIGGDAGGNLRFKGTPVVSNPHIQVIRFQLSASLLSFKFKQS